MKDIKKYPANKITLDELQKYLAITDYLQLVENITNLIQQSNIQPIKNAGINGKKPGLYLAYRILRDKVSNEKWVHELSFMVPELSGDYYLKHLEQYEADRVNVRRLNEYLLKYRDKLSSSTSINERSFEIFGREKFLLKEGGGRILKNLNLPMEVLNCYETSQPLPYYSHKKEEGQTIIIIENKDTFFSMRKHLLEGSNCILGVETGTLIYGGGKAVYRSVSDFESCMEPYMRSEKNQILYFGDLDYEGILIYEQVKALMEPIYIVKPFVMAYMEMLKKAKSMGLPISKEKQNKNGGSIFFEYFSEDEIKEIKAILGSGRYIPQEILQCGDF